MSSSIVLALRVFGVPGAGIRERLLAQDAIYVSGGNTANMLAVWRVHGVDAALREAWERGIVLSGPSAGGLCWFEGGVTDSFGPELARLDDGLGFLPGSFCPHYDTEPERRPTYERLATFADRFDEIRKRLDGAVQAYNEAAGSFESRILVSARRLRELEVTTGEELPPADPIERVPRVLKQVGLMGLPDGALAESEVDEVEKVP